MAKKDEKAREESAASWEDIDSLTPWDENPRINEHAVEEVVRSIRRFGFGAPLIARAKDRMIIAGHTRHLAAKELGLDRVPVRFLDLDPTEARLLALADNKVGESASWDDGALSAVLSRLQEEGADLLASGFDQVEIDSLLGAWEDPFAGEDDAEIVDESVRTIRVKVPLLEVDNAVDVVSKALEGAGIEAEVVGP